MDAVATMPAWHRRGRAAAVGLLWLAGLAWSLPLLDQAQHRWRHERIAAMVNGPFVPVELFEQHRRASDWRTPLLESTLPLAAVGAVAALRSLRRRPRQAGV